VESRRSNLDVPADHTVLVSAEFAGLAGGDMIDALGWFGSALIVASLMLRRPAPFRVLNLASAVVLLVFDTAIGLWSMVALNVAILAVNGWQLGRLVRRTPALDPAPPPEGWFTRSDTPAPRHSNNMARASSGPTWYGD
jgi:hypothetical protein